MFEGIPDARSAASIRKVPEPQKGSMNVVLRSHPDNLIRLAATTSLIGASPAVLLYPL